jgi:predicted ATPase
MSTRVRGSRRAPPPPSKPYLRQVSLKPDKPVPRDQYPFTIPAVRHLGELMFDPHVTFLVGENGTGKSTLIEAIAVALGMNPEGGSRNFNFVTRPSHSDLWTYLRLVRSWSRPRDMYFLRAESFFNVATEIENLDREGGGPPIIDAYGGRGLHVQSHGESFAALMTNRFRGNGLYLLDEPEAALSPKRQMTMLRRMRELVLQDSQFIVATHSPILMAYPNARILVLDAEGYTETPYTSTEHYRLMKAFLDCPEESVKRIFAESDQDQ